MFSLLVFLYIQRIQPTLAAPIQNLTALDTEIAPSWVKDPSGRGTWNLLYSCGFTLVLCVWTSIHLNVPSPHESAWISWRRKLKWVVIALFAPEAVVFTAFQQWLTAKCFLKELKKIAAATPSKNPEANAAQAEHSFDMVYAYYVVMGGFAVKIDHLHNTLKQGTLTTNALLLLAQHGHFFSLTKETISDKSKANYLAKGLVCIQVLWVAGQAIERKVAGFPISLLEFHTLVHVFCALVMYALWIRKPYDIQEPTIVSTDSFPHILAFIVSSSRWTGNNGLQKVIEPLDSNADTRKHVRDWIWEALFSRPMDPQFMYYGNLRNTPQAWVTKIPTGTAPLRIDDSRIQNDLLRVRRGPDLPGNPKLIKIIAPPPETPYFPGEKVVKSYKPANGAKEVLTLQSGQALKSGLGPRISWDPFRVNGKVVNGPVVRSNQGVRIALSQKDVDRLNLAADFIRVLLDARTSKAQSPPSLYPPQFSQYNNKNLKIKPFYPFGKGIIRPYDNTLICVRQSNWFNRELFNLFDTFGKHGDLYSFIIIALAIVIIPAAYGGIHLGAIHNIFPSEIELTLWKSSCYILLGFAGLLVVSSLGILALVGGITLYEKYMPTACQTAIDRWLEKKWVETIWLTCPVIICGAGCVLGVVTTLLYIAARLFIVVESFISLRHVPIGVYQTPDTDFMNYIPHL